MSLSFEGKSLKSLSQGDVDFGDKRPRQAVPIARPRRPPSTRLLSLRPSRGCWVSASPRCAPQTAWSTALPALWPAVRDPIVSCSGCCPCKSATSAVPNRSWKSTPAIPWSRGFPRPNSTPVRDLPDLCELLFDQALILDGDVPDDPAAFTKRMNRFVVRGLPPPIKARAPPANGQRFAFAVYDRWTPRSGGCAVATEVPGDLAAAHFFAAGPRV